MEYILNKRTYIGTAVAVLVIAVMAFFYFSIKVESRAPTGLSVDYNGYGTSTPTGTVNLGNDTARMVFATSTFCSGRIITTGASPLKLSFADGNATPTASIGHFQSASTTVVYDADQYGCGRIVVYPFDDTTITISETR